MDANHYTTNASVLAVSPNYTALLHELRLDLEKAVHTVDILQSSVQTLQRETSRVNSALKNRADVVDDLSTILAQLEISRDASRTVERGLVNGDFQDAAEQVEELFATASGLQKRGIKCADESLASAERLLHIACDKADQFFAAQTIFNRYSRLFRIYKRHSGATASKIQDDYARLAAKRYEERIRRAWKKFAISSMSPKPATPLIGELPREKGLDKFRTSIRKLLQKSTGGSPGEVSLTSRSATSLAVEEEPSELVASLAALLEMILNMIEEEACFAREFFGLEAEILAHLNDIFEPVLALFTRRLKEKIFAAANLGEVTLLYGRTSGVQLRDALDPFVNSVHHTFCDYVGSRVEILVMDQIASLEAALERERDRDFSSTIDIVSRKFAALIVDNISLVGKDISGEEHKKLLLPLVTAMDKYLGHSAAKLLSARLQSIFLINNYDYLVRFLKNAWNHLEHGKALLTECIQDYETKLNGLISMFAVDEVRPYFPLLFDFLAQRELDPSSSDATDDLTSIIADFNDHAAERIRALATSVVQSFSDQRTALFTANVIFTRLLTAYQTFLDCHDHRLGKRPWTRDQPLPMTLYALEQTLVQYHPSFASHQRRSPLQQS